MTQRYLPYAVITPARNETENLRRLAGCLVEQTVPPDAWVIVDNGSTDDTLAYALDLAKAHEWIRATQIPGERAAMPGAPIVRAFHAGLDILGGLPSVPDVTVKLDADVSFDRTYFETLLGAFDSDPTLGIAGGVCDELEDGTWIPTRVTGTHVRGASRAYRKACLEQVLPLEERLGWDSIDELKANVLGWSTRIVPHLHFRHHRRVGERDGGPTKRWIAQGAGAHYMGYRLWYLILRTLHHARSDPVALAMAWGYTRAMLRGEKRHDDAAVRALLRQQQSMRNLPLRIREATGICSRGRNQAEDANSVGRKR